jgi:hypothetical protein
MKSMLCPFCGKDEYGIETRFIGLEEYVLAVRCFSCRALGPESKFDLRKTPLEDSVFKAMSLWENRHE